VSFRRYSGDDHSASLLLQRGPKQPEWFNKELDASAAKFAKGSQKDQAIQVEYAKQQIRETSEKIMGQLVSDAELAQLIDEAQATGQVVPAPKK
jgi:hypothetical protein